jgi:hypothetical protein
VAIPALVPPATAASGNPPPQPRDPAEDKGVKAALSLFDGHILKVEEPRQS